MFAGCSSLENIYCSADANWLRDLTNAGMDYPEDEYMFEGCSNLPNFDSDNIGIDMAKPSTEGGYFTVYGSEPTDEMNNLSLLTSAGPALASKNFLAGNDQGVNAQEKSDEILVPLFRFDDKKQLVKYMPVLDPDVEYKDLKFYDIDKQLIEPKTDGYTQEQLADAYYYSGTDQFDVVRLTENNEDLDKDEFIFEQDPQDAQAKLEPKINGVAVQDIFDAWFLDSITGQAAYHKDYDCYSVIVKHINI